MNLQYVKYALEIARTGSISKAAENLSVAQPNLSRAVKELESQLGISIFERTRTGMTVTPQGEQLLNAGEKILRDVGELETMFTGECVPRESLSLAVMPAAYLSHAFMSYCAALPTDGKFDSILRQSDLTGVIDHVAQGDCKLGIIRIPLHFERYYTEKLASLDLKWEVIHEYTPVILMGMGSPLTAKEAISPADLKGLCEIRTPDSLTHETEGSNEAGRKEISVSDQHTLYALLSADPELYLCTSPANYDTLSRYRLMQKPVQNGITYRDLLISHKNHRPTGADEAFIRALKGTVRSLKE